MQKFFSMSFTGNNFGSCNLVARNCLKATGTPKQNAPVRALSEKCGTVRGQIKSPFVENASVRRQQAKLYNLVKNRVNQLTALLKSPKIKASSLPFLFFIFSLFFCYSFTEATSRKQTALAYIPPLGVLSEGQTTA